MKPTLNKFLSQMPSSLAGACGILLLLSAAQPSTAQAAANQQGKAAATPVATSSAAKLASPEAGAEQGETAVLGKQSDGTVKVHGHWVMNVRNTDGTLAEHREFENRLAIGQGGDAFLIGLLAGYYVPGDFAIFLQGTACPIDDGCGIVRTTNAEPGLDYCGVIGKTASACSTSLVYDVVLAPATGSTSLVLSGSVAAPVVGDIFTVFTVFNACGSTTGYKFLNPIVAPSGPSPAPPTNCVGSSSSALNGFLTGTSSFTPLHIAVPGQSVEVTVTITFS